MRDAIRLTREIISQSFLLRTTRLRDTARAPSGNRRRNRRFRPRIWGARVLSILYLRDGCRKFFVADNKDCIHGIDRLRITGASIMPSITGRNLNAPSIMVPQKTRK
jgi:hypothetical protein